MDKNQAHKFYHCKFCNRSFSDGMKYGVHIRGHMALFSGSTKQSTIEHDQETFDGEISELGVVYDGKIIKKSEESLGLDEDNEANFYRLRENPKKSWRVPVPNTNTICKHCRIGFNSMRDLANHMRSHSLESKESVEKSLCTKCGKGFDSVKALCGHMRWHTIKKSQPSNISTSSSSSSASSSSEDGKMDGVVKAEIFSPIRRKRSCTMYKAANPNDPSSSTSLSPLTSSIYEKDDDVTEAALCLMMLSRRIAHHEVDVSVDRSMMCFKKEDIGASGSGHTNNMNIVNNDLISNGQNVWDKGKRKVYDDQCDTDLRKSKCYTCSVCYKEFKSGQALGGHKRAHQNPITSNETDSKEEIVDDVFNIHGHMELERGIENDDDTDLRKSKCYTCSVCYKEFKSGQALGGHKRAHHNPITGNETDSKEETVDDVFNIHGHMELERGIKNDDDSFDMDQQ